VFAELLRSKLERVCELTGEQVVRLEQHYDLLVRWNRVINLTSLRRVEQIVERHYCESVFAACQLPLAGVSVADIGSGAGFPGIPIAILRPQSFITLVESHRRKAAFLREASRELPNVRVIAKRAEEIGGGFDWVVSRAVRYSEIAFALSRLGRNIELLTGEVSASSMPGFEWQAPIALPWGEHRYLWIGHAVVSRET